MPPEIPDTQIRARSQRQAMDWSLVLASQGIEHALDFAEDTGWSLRVNAADGSAATDAIKQYRVENRRWPLRLALPKAREFFDWTAGAWVLLTVAFYWVSQQRPEIEAAGIMNGDAVARGEWWRCFTATLLHADLAHLLSNAGFGLLLLGLALGRHGTGVGLLAAFLAGAAGNVLSWLAHGKGFLGLGASGVVMGALGLITLHSYQNARRHTHTLRLLLAGLAGGVMLFVVLGLSPGTDVVAHFGGFVAGVVFALLLTRQRSGPRPKLNLLAGVAFAALVVATWWLALRAG